MAKKTVTLEVCDQCGKEATTFEIVIHLPNQPAKVYDLCNIDYDALLAIGGGSDYNPGKKNATTPEQDASQARTAARAVRRRQTWDAEEVEFLNNNPLMSHEDAAMKLGRTFFAVRTKRHLMLNESQAEKAE